MIGRDRSIDRSIGAHLERPAQERAHDRAQRRVEVQRERIVERRAERQHVLDAPLALRAVRNTQRRYTRTYCAVAMNGSPQHPFGHLVSSDRIKHRFVVSLGWYERT